MALQEHSTMDTLETLCELPDEAFNHAYVYGAWVYVKFKEKPPEETRDRLKKLGFFYKGKTKTWRSVCGVKEQEKKYSKIMARDILEGRKSLEIHI